MGYACPVCDEPQQDTEHLANHLAFQAMTHGDDHESWLDEHTPGWADGGPADLAPRLKGLAEEAEYEVVFEDTSPDRTDGQYDPDDQLPPGGHGHEEGHGHGHGHGHEHSHGGEPGTFEAIDTSELDPEAQDIVAEAQELTREMLGDEVERADDDGAEADEDSEET